MYDVGFKSSDGGKFPLLMKFIMERSFKLFARREVVDRDFRYTYGEAYKRICKPASTLQNLG